MAKIFCSQSDLTILLQLDLIPPIHPSTNFALFLCSLVFAMFWVIYITFFNSRLVGSIVTNIANRLLPRAAPGGYIKVNHLFLMLNS